MLSRFRLSLRTLLKNKLILAINIIGLSIGLSAFLLLLVYINHELSYDKHFKNSERIVRLNTVWIEENSSNIMPICIREAYNQIPGEVPYIEASAQIYRGWGQQVKVGDEVFGDNKMLYVDTTFFKVFDIPFMHGVKNHPFNGKMSVVISNSLAVKAFGNRNPLGEILEFEDQKYTVSGVTEDLPQTTHLKYDVLMPMQAVGNLIYMSGLEFFTYYLLQRNADFEAVSNQIQFAYNKQLISGFSEFNATFDSFLEPLEGLHLFSKASFDLSPSGDIKKVWLVAGIALIILIIAIFNGVNLFIVYGQNRMVEIGIKKVSGASFFELNKQMLFEALIINFIAMIIALVVAYPLLPVFGRLILRSVSLTDIFSISGITSMVIILFLSTVFSGLYPLLNLAKINSIEILKGKLPISSSKNRFSSAIVIMQFSVAVLLIFGLLTIIHQVKFLKEKPLGFNPTNVYMFSNFDYNIAGRAQSLRNDLLNLPQVDNVAFSHHRMGGGCSGQGIKLIGSSQADLSINEYRVHPGFCDVFKIEMLQGRYFNQNESYSKDVAILNESAAKMLGITDIQTQRVDMFGYPMQVIGITKDFSYLGSGKAVSPLVLGVRSPGFNHINLKLNQSFNPEIRNSIIEIITKYDPDYLPLYHNVKDKFLEKFSEEERIAKIVGFGGFIAIFIGLMGLFAITVYKLQKRVKELGVRKVLGATTENLAQIVFVDLIKWMVVSVVIAWPLGYYLMKKWLTNYTDQAPIGIPIFMFSIVIPFVLAIVTIAYHTAKVIFQNPVKALKYE